MNIYLSSYAVLGRCAVVTGLMAYSFGAAGRVTWYDTGKPRSKIDEHSEPHERDSDNLTTFDRLVFHGAVVRSVPDYITGLEVRKNCSKSVPTECLFPLKHFDLFKTAGRLETDKKCWSGLSNQSISSQQEKPHKSFPPCTTGCLKKSYLLSKQVFSHLDLP